MLPDTINPFRERFMGYFFSPMPQTIIIMGYVCDGMFVTICGKYANIWDKL